MAFKKPINSLISDSKILVDTNIWLYLFGIQSSWEDPGYTDLLDKLIRLNAHLFVNSQIISEYINTTTRLAYKQYIKRHKLQAKKFQYKRKYRPTGDFNTNYEIAIESVKTEILELAQLTNANNQKTVNSIEQYNMLDFNDELIVNDALQNDLFIMTHDKDYLDYPEEIGIISL